MLKFKNKVFLILCTTLFFSACGQQVNKRWIAKEIEQEYKGIILKKIMRHTTIYQIKIDSAKVLEVGLMSGEFLNKARVGDSIYKVKNSNYCVLNNSDTVKYIHVPQPDASL